MERARRKDMMDGGVAQQRAKDFLAPLGDAILALTDDEDARDFVTQPYGIPQRAAVLAAALRTAYAEGYAEGLAAEDLALAEQKLMARTCGTLQSYMREHVREGNERARRELLQRIVNDLSAAFVTVARAHADLSHEKLDAMAGAFVVAVHEMLQEPEA